MSPVSLRTAVALFVRHPVPGRVKTRLARDLGDVPACELYRAMVADIIRNIVSSGLPLYLFHDGQDAAGLPPEWVNSASDAIRQVEGALGERMTAAFAALFSNGWERVMLSGSDIPGIDAQLLQAAIAATIKHDMAFCPAFDGGYCLVAARKSRFSASVFGDIPWSTVRVMEKTLEACTTAGVSCRLLDCRQDIDTLSDLETYCRQPSPDAISTNAWLISRGYPVSSPRY